MKKLFKWVGIIVGIILVIYLIDTKGGTTKGGVLFPVAKQSEWYKGGTLQHAKVYEWKTATDADRLATCADWVTANDLGKGKKTETEADIQQFQFKSLRLKAFMDSVIFQKDFPFQDSKLTDLVNTYFLVSSKK